MSSDQHIKTETVTKIQPSPMSSLPSGMPIADERVGVGKGGGTWLWIAAGVAAIIVTLFVLAL